MKRTPTVFPEVLPGEQGHGWQVEPQPGGTGIGGWTEIKTRRMAVPLTSDQQAENIRVHELGHAKWTPSRSTPPAICKRHNISMDALQRAEDMRVGYALIESGVSGYALGALGEADFTNLRAQAAQLLAGGNPQARMLIGKQIAFTTVSSAMTYDRQRLIDLADEVGGSEMRELVSQVADAAEQILFHGSLGRHRPGAQAVVPFRRTIEVARLLDRLFPPPGADSQRHKPHPKKGQPRWGTMKIEEPARHVLARVARLRHVTRSVDNGVSVRRLDRLMTDGRIFGTRRHVRGGTVLINASGSMGWSKQQIVEVVAYAQCVCLAAGIRRLENLEETVAFVKRGRGRRIRV